MIRVKGFEQWLVESTGYETGLKEELNIRLALIEKFKNRDNWYKTLSKQKYSEIYSELVNYFENNFPFGGVGVFEPGDLDLILDTGRQPVPFSIEWEPQDEEAEVTADDTNWDDLILLITDIEEDDMLKEAIYACESALADVAETSQDLEVIKELLALKSEEIDYSIITGQYKELSADILMELKGRYGENSRVLDKIKEHPNYPEDATEWALGDW
jgi:uncharacterized phage-like protein YoqJ